MKEMEADVSLKMFKIADSAKQSAYDRKKRDRNGCV